MLRNLLFHQAHVLTFSSNHISILISEICYCASECAIKKRDLIFPGSLSGERTIKQKDSEHIDVSRILPFTVSEKGRVLTSSTHTFCHQEAPAAAFCVHPGLGKPQQ